MTALCFLWLYAMASLIVACMAGIKTKGGLYSFDVLVITALWPVVVGAWVLNAFRRVK